MIKIVVFDMDSVLCRYRIERRLARLAAWSGKSPEAIHAAIWGSGFEDEAERGGLSADDYLQGFGERMGYPLSAAQWVEARRLAMEPDQAVLALARLLRVARPVGMFTNNPWLLLRHIADVFPAVPALFGPRAVFSAELGRCKPDPEAFRRLATRLKCAPDESLYFDDDAAYVAGAREAGLSAHRVGGAACLRQGWPRQISLFGRCWIIRHQRQCWYRADWAVEAVEARAAAEVTHDALPDLFGPQERDLLPAPGLRGLIGL
ncbi:MAG TPA: HAD family phosphatase [Candidatus Tectomicrobia bacterium]|nr:HAD family phosphatase [Candidatus Tectomicrobia bacterium]